MWTDDILILLSVASGLELYVPDDSRETRLLGRFPMRNRFISDHIFKKVWRRLFDHLTLLISSHLDRATTYS